MGTKFFGQFLIDHNAISGFDLVRVMKFQEKSNLSFGETVMRMGLMSAEEVAGVNEAQKNEDLPFGDLAVKLGYMRVEDVEQILKIQQNKHVYLGQALVALGALTQENLDKYLQMFHDEQQESIADHGAFPPGGEPHPIAEIIVDLTKKLLTRLTGLAFHLGPAQTIDHYPEREVIVEAVFNGDHDICLRLGFSNKTRILLSTSLLDDEDIFPPPVHIQDETLLQFVNLLSCNVASKASQKDCQIEMAPAGMRGSEIGNEDLSNQDALLFPVYLPDGEIIDVVILGGGE